MVAAQWNVFKKVKKMAKNLEKLYSMSKIIICHAFFAMWPYLKEQKVCFKIAFIQEFLVNRVTK